MPTKRNFRSDKSNPVSSHQSITGVRLTHSPHLSLFCQQERNQQVQQQDQQVQEQQQQQDRHQNKPIQCVMLAASRQLTIALTIGSFEFQIHTCYHQQQQQQNYNQQQQQQQGR